MYCTLPVDIWENTYCKKDNKLSKDIHQNVFSIWVASFDWNCLPFLKIFSAYGVLL